MTGEETKNNTSEGYAPGVNGGAEDVTSAGSEEDQVTRAEAKAAEYLDLLQRERASFINFRRRSEQERAETQQYATAQLLKKIIPVVDDLDRALQNAPAGDAWAEGVRMIARKLHALLEAEGVTPIESIGQRFDPALHEAVAYEEGGMGEDVVAEEFARGYKHKDKVLRHAVVKVGKGQPAGA
ncbi:MAG TPA: nucleotide exchange factor GrpE [Chloroflexia bacterium]|nr:nucleotide exchange factor GrpE [Chloroflexia bacterium]